MITKDSEGIGEIGDTLSVRAGFARNFLIPQKLAVYETDYNREKYRQIAEIRSTEKAAKIEAEKKLLEDVAEKEEKERNAIEEILRTARTFVFIRDANESGVTYGSVRKSEIADVILAEAEIDVNESQILLENDAEALSEIGVQTVQIKLGDDRFASVRVSVEAEAKE